jgi:DNA-binding beta-propeller fold protein YncE
MKTKSFVVPSPALGCRHPLAAAATVRIVQTNAAGDSVMLIDPGTNKVVGEITGIEVNHGAAVGAGREPLLHHQRGRIDARRRRREDAEGDQAHPADEPPEQRRGQQGRQARLRRHRRGAGAVDVIDTATLTRVKSIRTEGGIHNTYVTPGRQVRRRRIDSGKKINVIDQKTERSSGRCRRKKASADGVRHQSRRIDQTHLRRALELQRLRHRRFRDAKVVDKIPMPEVAAVEKTTDGLQGSPCHGLAVTPDGKTLAVLSKMNSRVYFVSLPDLKIVGETKVGHHPDWITLTPTASAPTSPTPARTRSPSSTSRRGRNSRKSRRPGAEAKVTAVLP